MLRSFTFPMHMVEYSNIGRYINERVKYTPLSFLFCQSTQLPFCETFIMTCYFYIAIAEKADLYPTSIRYFVL